MSTDVSRSLKTTVAYRGTLSERQRTNALGILYTVRSLEILGFRRNVIERAANSAPLVDRDDAGRDRVLLEMARRTVNRGESSQEALAKNLPQDLSLRNAEVLAAVVLAAKRCNSEAVSRLERDYTAPWSSSTSGLLSRRALVYRALRNCAPAGLTAAQNEDGARMLQEIRRKASSPAKPGDPNSILDLWQAQEAICAMGEEPTVGSAVAAVLPNVAPDQPALNSSHLVLYASARLTVMADGRCEGAWWDV